MEQKLTIIAKKFWNMVRVACFMLIKSISKAKLLADLHMMMKRGKIAGKAAIHNLIFHHHSAAAAAAASSSAAGRAAHEPQLSYPVLLNKYQFSCSNIPAYPTFRLLFHLNKRKHSHAPPQPIDSDLLAAAVEMASSVAPSPAVPGFGRSPMVRQLRITDSPFPLKDIDEDNHINEAAEKFIMKFHRDLRRQDAI